MCKGCRGWDEGVRKSEFGRGKVDVSDFDEEPRYRKVTGGSWRRKNKNCKKSKTGEKCDFSSSIVHGTRAVFETTWVEGRPVRRMSGSKPNVIRCCSRCGKYDWSSYSWGYLY